MKNYVKCRKILVLLSLCIVLLSFGIFSCGASDWFSSSESVKHTVTVQTLPTSAETALVCTSFKVSGGSLITCEKIYRQTTPSYLIYYYSNGEWHQTADAYNGSISLDYYTLTHTDGFVSSGFASALCVVGSITDFCLTDSTVVVIIGLAVGVSLLTFGISKVKSLIKGY